MSISIFDAALDAPEAIALVDDAGALTYAELAALAREVKVDASPVAFLATPTREAIALLHAAIASGSVVVPLHPAWSEEERSRFVAETAADAGPDALAILRTSGTSGAAKAAVLSRRAFEAAARASAANLPWKPGDRWLLALPFAHVGGLSVLLRCVQARATVVLATPGSDHIESIRRHRVTLASFVPTQLARLLADPTRRTPPESLRAVLLGGAAASPRLLSDAADAGWPVLTTYGLTEAASQVTTQHPGTVNRGELGSGAPLPGYRVRIAGDGVIEIRTPSLLSGYLAGGELRPPALTADGWLRTGDLGRLDGRGHLHVLGRADDVIVTGGEKVLPGDVEAALLEQPEIKAACVFGVDDPEWGQAVCAAIVPSGDPDQARRAIERAALSRYARPKRVVVVERLATNAVGKVDRRAVRAGCL